MQDDGAAVHRPGQTGVLRADVIERHGDGDPIDRANAHVDRGDIGRPGLPAVREHHAFRPPGRAAGVDQVGDRIGREFRDRRFRLLGRQRRLIVDVGPLPAEGDDVLQRAPRGVAEAIKQGRFADDDLRLAVREDVGDLRLGQPVVDRHRRPAAELAGRVDLQIFRAVLRQDREAVAHPKTEPL